MCKTEHTRRHLPSSRLQIEEHLDVIRGDCQPTYQGSQISNPSSQESTKQQSPSPESHWLFKHSCCAQHSSVPFGGGVSACQDKHRPRQSSKLSWQYRTYL